MLIPSRKVMSGSKKLFVWTFKARNVNLMFLLTGFGNFHYYLLFICGSLFAAISISVTSVSFIIPSAQCDFQMTSVHKGILNGASMIGTNSIPHIYVIFSILGFF